MPYYYDENPEVNSKERVISFEVCGQKIQLLTDNGVFSKTRVDEGSLLLIKTLYPLHLSGKILDLGCGYGTIGLSLCINNPSAELTLADINNRALELCKKNAINLGLKDRVTILQSDVYSNIEGKFSSIVINPPIRAGKKITYSMYEGALEHLDDGGALYIVIRKAQGAESASKYIKELFGNIVQLARNKGYLIYKAMKNINR